MTDTFERLKAALADRYTIERELGAGGMATVYLARDLRHERQVAIKVLRPDLAATLGPERFHREITIAAQLQHPNILPLLDSGEAGDLLYYVMPYIEGQSLRDKLAKEGELPIAEAVRILRDVVDALTAAHAHGVVHRDIKPENILLSGRHALVTDFGVAKAVSEATGREQLTTAGLAVGTPAYMAPEQAAADPHIDHRVDIYAVGAVAYELLTGRPVFMGTTPQMILAAHVTEAPRPVTTHRDTIPVALDSVVMRCLEKKPADRWQSADELLPQLEALATPSGGATPTGRTPLAVPRRRRRRAWAVGAVAVLALGVVSVVVSRFRAEGAPRVITVADFEHPPGDSALALALSQALRSQLQDVPQLFVPDRAETEDWCVRWLGLPACPADVDSQFRLQRSAGTHGMLTGSVQRLGPGFVLSVELRPTVPGPVRISLSETAADSTQLVDAFQELGERVRERLVEEMARLETPEGATMFTVRSREAVRIYEDADRSWGTDYITAVAGYRQAVRLDSTFAMARRRLAVGLFNLRIRRAEQLRESEAAYLLRGQLKPWERGMVAAFYYSSLGKRDRALEEYRRLLDDFPGYPNALNNSGVLYGAQRDFELAERLYRSLIGSDTTMERNVSFGTRNWINGLINLGRLDTVDSLFEMARANGANSGTYFDEVTRSRLIAERRYFEMRDLDARVPLGRSLNEYDRFRLVRQNQFTALVLGQLADYDSLAAEWAEMHRALDNGRGVLQQAIASARARIRFLDDSRGARRILEDALARQPFERLELLDRPYPELASARAEVGDAAEAQRLIESWEREVPAEYQGIDRERVHFARGDAALAAGHAAVALEHYRRGDVLGCVPCNLPRFGRAWESLGEIDSAIVTYERYISTPSSGRISADAFELANAYLRLGELYERRGDNDNAVRYYNELIELWREADPELQRQVDDVRGRIARLAEGPRRG